MSTHSPEWWEGFRSKRSRNMNPYAAGQPWLAEYPDKKLIIRCDDWWYGWDCRFYGEKP